MMKLFSSRKIEKIYWALVNGSPLPMKGVIDLALLKKINPKAEGMASGPHGRERDYEIMQVDEERKGRAPSPNTAWWKPWRANSRGWSSNSRY